METKDRTILNYRRIQFLLNNHFKPKLESRQDELFIKVIPHSYFNNLCVEVDLWLSAVYVCCEEQYLPVPVNTGNRTAVIIKRDISGIDDESFYQTIQNILRIFN